MRFISILLICTLVIGCDEDAARQNRKRRRDDGRNAPIVEPSPTPIKVDRPLTAAQRKQISARADMFGELAAGVRSGNIKTIWDVNKFCLKSDADIRSDYDTAFGSAMADKLGKSAEGDLQSDAADIFDDMKKQFEALLK